jgi:hypothetical protein
MAASLLIWRHIYAPWSDIAFVPERVRCEAPDI